MNPPDAGGQEVAGQDSAPSEETGAAPAGEPARPEPPTPGSQTPEPTTPEHEAHADASPGDQDAGDQETPAEEWPTDDSPKWWKVGLRHRKPSAEPSPEDHEPVVEDETYAEPDESTDVPESQDYARTEFLPLPGETVEQEPMVEPEGEAQPEPPEAATLRHALVPSPSIMGSEAGVHRWYESATPPHRGERKLSARLLLHVVSWSVHHRSIVVLFAALVAIAGLAGASSLKRELLPSIDFPLIVVGTPVPGSDPQSVADEVTSVIEAAVSGLQGVKHYRSTSVDGFSNVVVEYGLDVDAGEAERALEEAVAAVDLPQGAQPPSVTPVSTSGQVAYRLAIDANGLSEERLSTAVHDSVVPLLREGKAVADVRVRGGLRRRIDIRLDPDKMKKHKVSVEQVEAAIRSADLSLPAGSIPRGDKLFSVRVGTSLAGLEALGDLVIGSSGSGSAFSGAAGRAAIQPAPVVTTTSTSTSTTTTSTTTTTLPSTATTDATTTADAGTTTDAGATTDASVSPDAAVQTPTPAPAPTSPPAPAPKPVPAVASRTIALHDVATVAIVDTRPDGISRTDGEDGLTIEIFKEPDGNSIELSQSVNEAVPVIDKMLGEAEVTKVFDEADSINSSIDGLLEEAAIGVVLVVLIVLAFLRSGSATFITVVAIPVSVLVALLFARIFGLTLNIMTLAGLTIAIGRVIDDAIVVLENIYARIQRGEAPVSASVNGTAEVAAAITSSTLTAVAVFLPIGLVGGIISDFFLSFSLIVTCALLASLIVSVTLVPVLANLILRRPQSSRRQGEPLLQRFYSPILRFSLRHRALTVIVAVALFVGSLAIAQRIPVTFLPSSGLEQFGGKVTLAAGTKLDETGLKLQQFEEVLDEDPGIARYAIDIGGSDPFATQATMLAENEASIYVRLKKGTDADAAKARLEGKGRQLYGEGFLLTQIQAGPPSGTLEVILTNPDPAQLTSAGGEVTAALAKLDGVENVRSDVSVGKEEFTIEVDSKKAAAKGMAAAPAAATLRSLINGSDVGDLKVDGDDIALYLAVDEERADSPEDLAKLPLLPVSGVDVEDIAAVTQVKGPVAVTRTDGEPSVRVSGEITTQDTSGVTRRAEAVVERLGLPAGTRVTLGGDAENQQDAFRDMGVAMIIAVVLVYLVLVLFFGSLLHPFTIILSLPLASIGAFGGLFVAGKALELPALLGILMLIGIVVANAILLVDFIQKAREQGVAKYEAQTLAGRRRVRPILMTAVVTIGALVPLALGLSGEGSQLVTGSLAVVVIGGLATSTLLTLAVIPAVYSLLDSGRAWAFAEEHDEWEHDIDENQEHRYAETPGAADPFAGDPFSEDPYAETPLAEAPFIDAADLHRPGKHFEGPPTK